jgi:hypothetical protein
MQCGCCRMLRGAAVTSLPSLRRKDARAAGGGTAGHDVGTASHRLTLLMPALKRWEWYWVPPTRKQQPAYRHHSSGCPCSYDPPCARACLCSRCACGRHTRAQQMSSQSRAESYEYGSRLQANRTDSPSTSSRLDSTDPISDMATTSYSPLDSAARLRISSTWSQTRCVNDW